MSDFESPRATQADDLEIIEFYIDEVVENGSYRSYYGMNVAKVIEIIRLPGITEVPSNHHSAALGTFNWRDKVLPLVDLGLWLNKETVGGETQKVIVSEFSGITMAFIVSGVTRIHRMTWARVEPPGKYLQSFSQDCVIGIVKIEDRILFLLDMEYIIGSMDPSIRLDSHTKPASGENIGQGYHVLIADDSPSVRTTLAYCLEQENFLVTQTTCGPEAWDQLEKWAKEAAESDKSILDFVNLVISDIEMPEMDGHLLTNKIKIDPRFKGLPVVLFSSMISDVVREKGIRAGADGQIAKPDLPRLTEIAVDLISKSLAEKDD